MNSPLHLLQALLQTVIPASFSQTVTQLGANRRLAWEWVKGDRHPQAAAAATPQTHADTATTPAAPESLNALFPRKTYPHLHPRNYFLADFDHHEFS